MTELHAILGAGPVGRAIARQLLAEGRRVRLVTRSGKVRGLEGAEVYRADIADPDQATIACMGATTVYFCVAPAYSRWVAEFPALQDGAITAAARAGAVLVAVENLYAYGVAGDLHEGLPLSATTRKGRTRAIMTERLFAAHARGDLRAVAGRAADYFGPEARVSTYGARLWQPLLRGKPVSWFGDPDAPHSTTYVPDFAAALIRLGAEPAAWGRAWHVPSPPPVSPRAFIAAAARAAGLPAPKVTRLPKFVLGVVGLFNRDAAEVAEMSYSFDQPFVLRHDAFDAAFGSRATDLDTALGATAAWWRGQS